MSCQGYSDLGGILRASQANALDTLPKRFISDSLASGVSLTLVTIDLIGLFDFLRGIIISLTAYKIYKRSHLILS